MVSGDIRYKDLNDDGVIDQGDRTLANSGDQKVIGNSTPRYRFNLQGGIGWHGVKVNVLFEGVCKRDLWTGVIFSGDSPEVFITLVLLSITLIIHGQKRILLLTILV